MSMTLDEIIVMLRLQGADYHHLGFFNSSGFMHNVRQRFPAATRGVSVVADVSYCWIIEVDGTCLIVEMEANQGTRYMLPIQKIAAQFGLDIVLLRY